MISLGLALMGLVSSAWSAELKPLHNYSLHFGSVSGSVFVDPTGSDPRLVATLSSGQDAVPIRFVTTLAAEQKATVSVPRGLGEAAFEVTFIRRGEQVLVDDGETLVGSIK